MTSSNRRIGKRNTRRAASAPRRETSAGAMRTKVARLARELEETMEQQKATAEVLRIISASPGELAPVFLAILSNAMRICEARLGHLLLYDKETGFRAAQLHEVPPAYREFWDRGPIRPGPNTALARMVSARQAVHIADLASEQAYSERDPLRVATVELAGMRTFLGVPMLKDEEMVGAIAIYRQEVRPFTEKQIALLKSFASQAVIAIENARLLNEIQQKGRQLAEASRHKSQFLANMSHELRTPLNAILGYTELIIDNIYGEPAPKMREVLTRIESNGRHLLGLINDVLDLSKIEAGQLKLTTAEYSLKNVVNAAMIAVEPLAAEKNLLLTIKMPGDLPTGYGDEHRLTQVLLNLLGNATKFTESGEVTVEAASADGWFHVIVRDTGPGISPADQTHLFQEFQQIDNSITKKKAGTGLGLAISKHIVEMHGGKIRLDSVVGRGSTFSFTIPVRMKQKARHA